MLLFFSAILVIPLMLIFSGLAVDLSALGVLRDRAQVAADAGAVAGASSIGFQKDDPKCMKDCTGQWVANLDVPKAYAALNGFPADVVTFDPGTPAITVKTSGLIKTSFLRLIGINSLATQAQAKAARTNITQEVKDAKPPVPGRSALTQ